jgi:CBS domain containing-hemolysin-like protein
MDARAGIRAAARHSAAVLAGVPDLRGLSARQVRRDPPVGQSISADGWRFEVVDLDGRRIDKVLASRE